MKCNRVHDPMLKHISTNSKKIFKNDSNNYLTKKKLQFDSKMLQIFISKLLVNNNNGRIVGID